MLRLAIILILTLSVVPSLAFAHPPAACESTGFTNGFLSIGNIGMFIGGLVVLIGALVAYFYFGLPIELLRWVLLVAGGASVYYSQATFLGLPAGFWVFFGAAGIGGFILWSAVSLLEDDRDISFRLALLVASVVWGVIALSYDDSVVGLFSVLAFGFVIASTKAVDLVAGPLTVGGVSYSGSCTLTGLIILVMYVVGVRLGLPMAPFNFGALYVSGLVLSSSLLVNTWGSLSRSWGSYLVREALFLSYATLAMVFGGAFNLANLTKMGGTFLVFWGLSKVVRLVMELFSWFENEMVVIITLVLIGVGIILGSSLLIDYAYALEAYLYLP